MRASWAWWAYGVASAALALAVLWNWAWAVTFRGPVLYGEGAVAHAAILARADAEYSNAFITRAIEPIFVAANYPPLYFHLAGIGDDPFVTGRALSIIATLFVAGAIAWRARPAGVLVAATIALAWIASVPVMQWGAAVKPDPVALAFTVGAVVALARERPNHLLAGALVGAAVLAKPTALVPGLALLAYVARRDPLSRAPRARCRRGHRGSGLPPHAPAGRVHALHVIDWNALPWRVELSDRPGCGRAARAGGAYRNGCVGAWWGTALSARTSPARWACCCLAVARGRRSTTSSISRLRSL